MSRPISLQVHVTSVLAQRVRAAAAQREITVSEWIRSILTSACDDDDFVSRLQAPIDRMARQSVFLMVGIDALLAGHADDRLRERAHQAYARKCKELGLTSTVDVGGSDEA